MACRACRAGTDMMRRIAAPVHGGGKLGAKPHDGIVDLLGQREGNDPAGSLAVGGALGAFSLHRVSVKHAQPLQARGTLFGPLAGEAGVTNPLVKGSNLLGGGALTEQMNLVVNQHGGTIGLRQGLKQLWTAYQTVENFMVGAVHGIRQLPEQDDFFFALALNMSGDDCGNLY
ncbi:Unknown protein sequence [Pseudomonas syringae pv. spinaceae]|uniref:Uncharacterized protein n=1 Tax=Pseudomonas syringae pv. spinaceae TaxID=264459 RepID=A0A0N8T652_PSESX|nr:Unknown protein sequence [Pseudomonas syringae pv. spinaceae]